MLFESLIRTFLHPQDALLTISFCLSGNRASRDCESCTHEIGSHKSPNSDEMFTHVFLASIGNFPRREIDTYEVVIHYPRESLIPDPRCHLALTPARVDLLTPVLHYVLNPVGKSRIGILRFPLSCARDFQFPDPRLCGISCHVSLPNGRY
jgi:hypothetical protein